MEKALKLPKKQAERRGASSGDAQRFILDGIRSTCARFKGRAPGSAAERAAQAHFKETLASFADDVQLEKFKLHPGAFLGFMDFMGPAHFACTILFWLTLAGVVSGIAPAAIKCAVFLALLAVIVFEFAFYCEFTDFLYPEAESANVMARLEPRGEVKRRVIFVGHADASNEWTYHYGADGAGGPVMQVMFAAVGGLVVDTALSAIWLVFALGGTDYSSPLWLAFGIVSSLVSAAYLLMRFFENKSVIVDGANDNLSASYVAMAVLKELKEKGGVPEHTEVCCLITGSEEAGLRGANAYARRHLSELKATETVVVAMDTLHEVEKMQIYTMGKTGTQKNSNAVSELIFEAAHNCGLDMPECELYPGAIDSEAFSKFLIHASGFCGVDGDPKTYYHTRLDNADNIGEDCIKLSTDICLEIVRLYEASGGIAAFREAGRKRFRHGANL